MVAGQNKPCAFDPNSLQFEGSPLKQARCLLRENSIGGVLDYKEATLPSILEKLVGQKVKLARRHLRMYLQEARIAEGDLGGSLDDSLASSRLPGGQLRESIYFVIHDTSSPFLGDDPFPSDMNSDAGWKGDNLQLWLDQPVAHVFVNRLGNSVTTTRFSEPVKMGWGTKFARDILKVDAKGLEIHIELIQPRRRDPNDASPNNDRIAPVPDFTSKQYLSVALLCVCARSRRGLWMIPAYHAALDAGIKDAHDDPQNFSLKSFAKQLSKLIRKID